MPFKLFQKSIFCPKIYFQNLNYCQEKPHKDEVIRVTYFLQIRVGGILHISKYYSVSKIVTLKERKSRKSQSTVCPIENLKFAKLAFCQ